MIKGYVINNLGRGKHVFKRSVPPGSKVPLEQLFSLYSRQYSGNFDTGFLDWLDENKIPKGFDIVIESINTDDLQVEVQDDVHEDLEEAVSVQVESISGTLPNRLTARQISDLKMKDNPKKVIQEILSIHKLRRAQTLCKGRAGKETLLKMIKDRITELS